MVVTREEGDDPALFENDVLPVVDGRCAYLIDGRCSIYDKRPKVCRAFDCRIMALAGTVSKQPEIAKAVQSWDVRGFVKRHADRIVMTATRRAVPYVAMNPNYRVWDNGQLRRILPEEANAEVIAERALQIHERFVKRQ